MDRVLASEAKGRGFDPRQPRHNTILRGHKYISYGVAELLTSEPVDSEKPLHETLSQREYEIFYKLGQGQGVTQIADELCLSVKTVSTYARGSCRR